MTLRDLPNGWRARAEELRPYSPPAAEAWSRAADELDTAIEADEDELVPPAEAAKVSGLSERTLRERKAKGQLEDHGTPGRPLYRRGDLPRRGRAAVGGFDADEHVSEITGRAS